MFYLKKTINLDKKKMKKYPEDTLILNDRYIVNVPPISEGNTENIYVIKDITGEEKVIKLFLNENGNFEKKEKIFKEVSESDISSAIIKYYESGIGTLTCNLRKRKKKYIMMELATHGNLNDSIPKDKGFSEEICKFVFSECLKGIELLHKKGISHRDIKGHNFLLVGDNFNIKLCDFGLSTKFVNENNNKIKLKERVGTRHFKAPEILEYKEYDGDKIDIFSTGVLLFILRTGKMAFDNAVVNDNIYQYIANKNYNQYWAILENDYNLTPLSDKFKNLFVKLVAYYPEERPSIEEIRKDEWMQDMLNLNDEQLKELRENMKEEIKNNKFDDIPFEQ